MHVFCVIEREKQSGVRLIDCRVKDDVTGLGTGTRLLLFCSKKAVTDQTKILFSVSEHKQ